MKSQYFTSYEQFLGISKIDIFYLLLNKGPQNVQ